MGAVAPLNFRDDQRARMVDPEAVRVLIGGGRLGDRSATRDRPGERLSRAQGYTVTPRRQALLVIPASLLISWAIGEIIQEIIINMDEEQFETALAEVRPGQYAELPYEIFETLFPPGVQSDDAKDAAYAYAKARGFRIEHRPDLRAVWFVRDGGVRGEAQDPFRGLIVRVPDHSTGAIGEAGVAVTRVVNPDEFLRGRPSAARLEELSAAATKAATEAAGEPRLVEVRIVEARDLGWEVHALVARMM